MIKPNTSVFHHRTLNIRGLDGFGHFWTIKFSTIRRALYEYIGNTVESLDFLVAHSSWTSWVPSNNKYLHSVYIFPLMFALQICNVQFPVNSTEYA